MSHAITIPRLGWSMEEGVFAGWLKRDGETVRVGEPLFSLEGEKATQDVEATDAGVLRIPAEAPQTGDTVAVGAVIGYLVAEGTSESAPGGSAVRTNFATEVPRSGPDEARPRSSPLARRVARRTRGRLDHAPRLRHDGPRPQGRRSGRGEVASVSS